MKRDISLAPESFQTFGDLLTYLRKQTRLTQDELSRVVGYSRTQITRLEKNQRLPDLASVAALFIPAFDLSAASPWAARLLQLAAATQGTPGAITITRTVQRSLVSEETIETVFDQPRPTAHLPAAMFPLLGRALQIDQITPLLIDPAVRLLTLLGPPGVGKTRLALQLAWNSAAHFIDGAYWIDLAPLTDPAAVPPLIRQVLGLPETPGGQAAELARLRDYLNERHVLLILDNFEQIVEAGWVVAELLAAAPQLKILITSRQPLRVYGEYECLVPPLLVPDLAALPAPDELAQLPAVQLLIERAGVVSPHFVLTRENALAVAAIVVQLDGLPLAIELAAAQLKTFSAEELAAKLVNRLATLTRGPHNRSARQQTLRGAIEWSYQRLTTDQQRLFARLGVFVGGFTGEAVTAVCESDQLTELIEANLIHGADDLDHRRRFTLLETLREYAVEQLSASGVEQAVRVKHARYFLKLAETAEPHLSGADQAVWLKRLAAEQANFNAALTWAQSAGESGGLIGLRLSGALWRFWWMHSHLNEGRRWLTCFIATAAGDQAELYRAKALHGAGVLAYYQADYDEARSRLESSLAIYRAAADLRGAADALNSLGVVASYQSEYDQSAKYHAAALPIRRQLNDQRGVAISLNNLALIAHYQEDYARAVELFQQSITLFEALGDVRVKSAVLSNLGRALTGQGEYSQARMCLRRSLSMVRELGNREDSIESIEGLAGVAGATGDAGRGAMLLGAAEALREKIQSPVALVARCEYERDVARIQDQLDPGLFAATWSKGRAMTLEQAIELALAG
jgi:predicted ATPase/transcriptional regulator with XRE-family HTH domain